MTFYLNKLIINGVKNIDKPIELLFSNKTISSSIDCINSKVKAIYGPNGSGKSGIVSAVYIYKKLVDDPNGLNDKLLSSFILEVVNKNTNTLSIEVYFSLFESNIITSCYKHTIVLAVFEDTITIKKEEISILKGKSIIDENFKCLVLTENGMLTHLKTKISNKLTSEPIYINSLNLIDKHSITNTIFKFIKYDKDEYIGDDEVINSMLSIVLFSTKLIVELNKEDTHTDYIINKIYEKFYSNNERFNNKFEQIISNIPKDNYFGALSTKNRDIVNVKEFNKYEENIDKLTKFIKLFKNDLDEIIIDKKIDNDKYYCDKIFKYGDIQINIEFESTGIKKLVNLFFTLNACANGSIAFIDEMDANLHDVYFARLIEFYKNDSRGQLCFTTHNLEPINILKDSNHSLDFLSNDSKVYSWVKNGNSSPLNKYINGLIPYSPFNIDSFDFDLLLDDK